MISVSVTPRIGWVCWTSIVNPRSAKPPKTELRERKSKLEKDRFPSPLQETEIALKVRFEEYECSADARNPIAGCLSPDFRFGGALRPDISPFNKARD
jgi:hypothetical protein